MIFFRGQPIALIFGQSSYYLKGGISYHTAGLSSLGEGFPSVKVFFIGHRKASAFLSIESKDDHHKRLSRKKAVKKHARFIGGLKRVPL